MRRSVLSSAALLIAWGLAAGPAAADKVDDYVRRQMRGRNVPGVSVAVVQEGKVAKIRGYGLANVELAVPATAETVYQLASVTKQFTATAVMMLVEEGKIDLDETITRYLEGLPAAWGEVTVRHLLNHTSGIKSYTGLPDFAKSFRKDYTKDELIRLVADLPLEFAPGERFSYNNTGYFLLGMLIEKVSGKEYGTFLKERIFDPLGMTRTRVNDLTAVIPNRATGYGWSPKGLRNGEYVSPTQPYAAGALVSTVTDLVKWDAALDGERLLKRATLLRMWRPTRLNDGKTHDYGFGWSLGLYRTRPRVHHGGGIPGFSTYVARYPEERLTVIVLANSETANAGSLADGIAAFYIPALVANAPKPIPDSDAATTERLREVMARVAAGDANPEWFTETARKVLFPDRIAEAKAMLGSHGKLKAFDLMAERTDGAIRVREYRASFGDLTLRGIFGLTAEGKIDRLGMRPE